MSIAIAGLAFLSGLAALYLKGTVRFVDDACANLDAVLPQQVVGQELALATLTDALCHHLAQPRPAKPLVISVHGPPGVGKTHTHLWLARILYSRAPSAVLQCPGMHCKGYKVVYGLDYLLPEAATRLEALRGEVLGHLGAVPDSLLVVEEYDKMDCAARGLWRQLLQHPERANITNNRAVILLESNLGMSELEEMLSQLGDRSKVTMQSAEALLRGVVFAQWRASRCESYEDTAKLMSLIDVFLPYLPLERGHMPALVALALRGRAALLAQARRRVRLQWEPDVAEFLAGQVEFAGPYPLDGAKVIEAAITRQVGRPLRQAAALPGCAARWGCTLTLSVSEGWGRLVVGVRNNTRPGAAPKPAQQQPSSSKEL